MSLGQFSDDSLRYEPSVVTELGSACQGNRVVASGTIVPLPPSLTFPAWSGCHGYRCSLYDGTGRIDLVFLGRHEVPNLTLGARCAVEGTARVDHGRLTLWNPVYRLDPAGLGGAWPPRWSDGSAMGSKRFTPTKRPSSTKRPR